MTFKKIMHDRYKVLFDENSPIVARRAEALKRKGDAKSMDPRFAGTVSKETFFTYDAKGKRVERHFWTARTVGYMMVPGKFDSRNQAAQALLKGEA